VYAASWRMKATDSSRSICAWVYTESAQPDGKDWASGNEL